MAIPEAPQYRMLIDGMGIRLLFRVASSGPDAKAIIVGVLLSTDLIIVKVPALVSTPWI
jgi:hypothetical protein